MRREGDVFVTQGLQGASETAGPGDEAPGRNGPHLLSARPRQSRHSTRHTARGKPSPVTP